MLPNSRPLQIAVVGAGPAGFYATDALLKSGELVRVDIFERLPSPHGLVRFGVAPDHETVKSKAYTFDTILKNERVRYFGNVAFGKDVSHDDLKRHYDALIYTVGASSDRALGIPGEDLSGSLSATEFVAWYNAHPYHADLNPALTSKHAAVVGMGNVALDVARALCKDPDDLAKTDMAEHAVKALEQSQVTDVHILGRRGPAQANFTPKELREVDELPNVELIVKRADIAANQFGSFQDELQAKKARRNLELFSHYANRKTAGRKGASAQKRVHIHFFVSPVEVLGTRNVVALKLERNRLVAKGERLSAVGTGEFEVLELGLLLRSVGYRSVPLKGVPFDEKRGIIPNVGGRVTTLAGDSIPGEYTSGWVRRGASGVIGTNKIDAEETVRHLLADRAELPLKNRDAGAIYRLLEDRRVDYVTKEDWQRISRAERRNGSRKQRRAVKFHSVEAMLSAAHS